MEVKTESDELDPYDPVTNMILDFVVRLDAPDFDKEVKLPKRFAFAVVWDFPPHLQLWHPGGRESWEVIARFGESQEDLFLADGWDVFVRDHGLKRGWTLHFHYCSAGFSILVFDDSLCSRHYGRKIKP